MKTTDSTHEEYFQWWLSEAIAAGIIIAQQNPLPYTLCEQVWIPYQKVLATKIKSIRKELLKSWTYTPDFIFYWNPKYLNKLFADLNNVSSDLPKHCLFLANKDITGAYYSVVDVKSSVNRFGMRNSDITFPLAQKQLFASKRIYVQKIVVFPLPKDNPYKTLFGATWVPQDYKKELYYKRDYKRNNVVLKKEGTCKVDWTIRSVIDFVK